MPRYTLCFTFLLLGVTTTANAQYSRTLRLNGSDNEAVIEDDGNPGDDFIQIRSTNDSFETIRFRQPDEQLVLKLGAGDDTVSVRYPLDCSVHVYGASGNDVLKIESVVDGDVLSDDVRGGNRIEINSGAVVEGDVIAIDGPRTQALYMNNSWVKGSIYFDSPNGGSAIIMSMARVGTFEVLDDTVSPRVTRGVEGNILVNNRGDGADTFRISRGSIAGEIYLDLGDGDFSTSIIQAGAEAFTSIIGTGDTDAFLGEFGSRTNINLLSSEGSMDLRAYSPFVNRNFVVRSGLGYDKLLFSGLTRSGSDAQVVLDIDNGDGGSEIELNDVGAVPFSSRVENVIIRNGSEADSLKVSYQRPTSYIRSLQVDNGTGDSVTTIEDTFADNEPADVGDVTVSASDGFAMLEVLGSVIKGDLVAYTGDGGSHVVLEDASISGDVDIFSNRGRDSFSIVRSFFAGRAAFRTGRGKDTVSVADSTFDGDFIAKGASGNDTFIVRGENAFNGIYYVRGFENEVDE